MAGNVTKGTDYSLLGVHVVCARLADVDVGGQDALYYICLVLTNWCC